MKMAIKGAKMRVIVNSKKCNPKFDTLYVNYFGSFVMFVEALCLCPVFVLPAIQLMVFLPELKYQEVR